VKAAGHFLAQRFGTSDLRTVKTAAYVKRMVVVARMNVVGEGPAVSKETIQILKEVERKKKKEMDCFQCPGKAFSR
jgi:hypothetical protein